MCVRELERGRECVCVKESTCVRERESECVGDSECMGEGMRGGREDDIV